MRPFLALTAAAVLSVCGIARADTYSVFTLNANLAIGSASGTLTLDTTTGRFTGSNVTAGTTTFTSAPTSFTQYSGYDTTLFSGTGGSIFTLDLPVASLMNYTGGALCSTSAFCGTLAASSFSSGLNAVTSGTLTLNNPVAVTPEPSSVLLLGSGALLIAAVVLARRFV